MDASAYKISFDSNLLSILYADYVKSRDALGDENSELRELVQRLYANLRNRETLLELMGMPPSEAAKDEVRAIIDKCSELGVEVDE